MIDQTIYWMGTHFSPESYLFWTRIQCLLWTAADVVIVYSLLRIANTGRKLTGDRLHRGAYVVLSLTLLPAPLVAFAETGGMVFLVELLVTVPHFLLILYLLWANRSVGPAAWAMLCTRAATSGSGDQTHANVTSNS